MTAVSATKSATTANTQAVHTTNLRRRLCRSRGVRTRRKVLGQGAGGTRSGTDSPANGAESRKDAAVQRRVAYKNMTREQENTRPEEGAPFRSDRDPLAAQHE